MASRASTAGATAEIWDAVYSHSEGSV